MKVLVEEQFAAPILVVVWSILRSSVRLANDAEFVVSAVFSQNIDNENICRSLASGAINNDASLNPLVLWRLKSSP